MNKKLSIQEANFSIYRELESKLIKVTNHNHNKPRELILIYLYITNPNQTLASPFPLENTLSKTTSACLIYCTQSVAYCSNLGVGTLEPFPNRMMLC